jgi:hypothetical protein
MIQLDFAGGGKGITFAIGAGNTGGVSVLSRTMGMKKDKRSVKATEDIAFERFGDVGTNIEVRVEDQVESGAPTLAFGRNYDVRVRRVNDAVSCYVNGKRVGYVRCPDFKGKVDLVVGAPGRLVSIGRVSAREISSSCNTPAVEPLLGEFGYVLGGDAAGILVDSSMSGIAVNGVVSFAAVEKIIEGEKSKTVFFKRVGMGAVKELGPMTAVIQRTDAGEPIKKGTKVLKGAQPLSFYFNDARISSIDEGL